MSMSLLCNFNKKASRIANYAAKVEALLCVTDFESKAQYSKRARVRYYFYHVPSKQIGELIPMLVSAMCKQLLHNVITKIVSAKLNTFR